MNRCLSDQSLLECYTGEGKAGDLLHLENCLPCTARYRALGSDMALITQSLAAAPPARRPRPFLRWRMALPAAAVALAFMVGWSLRGVSMGPAGTRPVRVASNAAVHPIQLSAAEMGPAASTSAIYAGYVQDAFSGDPCSEGSDPLEPGCL
jgi:hypothetical protein